MLEQMASIEQAFWWTDKYMMYLKMVNPTYGIYHCKKVDLVVWNSQWVTYLIKLVLVLGLSPPRKKKLHN
jgi:hypothetical protein